MVSATVVYFPVYNGLRFRIEKDMILFRDRGSKAPVYVSSKNPVHALIEREKTYYLGDAGMAELLAEDLEQIYKTPVEKKEITDGKWLFYLESSF